MNDNYRPLVFPGLESYPQDYDSFIESIKNKIVFCKKNNLNALRRELENGLIVVKSIAKERIEKLNGLDFYRIGFNDKGQYSVQIWSRYRPTDLISYKKQILFVLKFNNELSDNKGFEMKYN